MNKKLKMATQYISKMRIVKQCNSTWAPFIAPQMSRWYYYKVCKTALHSLCFTTTI